MKLVFIKKSFSIHGGIEKYMKALLDLLKDKAEISILAKNWIDTPGIKFQKINSLSFCSFLSIIAFNYAVSRKAKKIKPDCVISFERTTCQDIYRAGEGCHKEWLKIRKKTDPFWKKYTFFINPLHIALLRIEKKLFSDSKLIIAISNMVKSDIIKNYNIPNEKIKVIYNGVNLIKFSPSNVKLYRSKMRKKYSINEDAEVVLFVGSGFERKGLRTLLNALPKAVSGNKNIKLLVIGKGNVKKFKKIAEQNKIYSSVLFLKPQAEIEKFYAAADIFVLPTLYEPFGNVMLEAMASGLPVITTSSSGAAELIKDGEEGFVLKNPEDYFLLAEYIKKALSNKKSMSEKARLKAETYPILKAADDYLDTILEYIRKKNKG